MLETTGCVVCDYVRGWCPEDVDWEGEVSLAEDTLDVEGKIPPDSVHPF